MEYTHLNGTLERKPILYTVPTCQQCKIIKHLLGTHNIEFDVCDDLAVMDEKRIMTVPMLEVDGELLNGDKTMKWIRAQVK